MSTSKPARPQPSQPPPKTPTDILMDMHKRMVRIETRIGRIMEHLGLDSRGDPINGQNPN